ncbi:MAG: CBS domain-containing protein [Myxococcota bacterium]
MTRWPRTVDVDDSLDEARRAMTEGGFHHVPVVAAGHLVGMLSATDLLRVVPGAQSTPLQADGCPRRFGPHGPRRGHDRARRDRLRGAHHGAPARRSTPCPSRRRRPAACSGC